MRDCHKCEYPFKTLWSLIFSVHVIIFNNDFVSKR